MSTEALAHDAQDHGPAKGLMRWVTTTNHKDIGTLYLLFSLLMFLVGGAMALINTAIGFTLYLVYERVWSRVRWGRHV